MGKKILTVGKGKLDAKIRGSNGRAVFQHRD